jgi:hypothetical protein
VRLDHIADVGGQLRVLDFAGGVGAGLEVVDTAEAVAGFVQAGGDGLASPAEALLGSAGAAATKAGGHLGVKGAALVSLETPGGGADQLVGDFGSGIHRRFPPQATELP